MYSRDLFDYIEENTTLANQQDLFYGFIPAESKSGLVVRLNGGTENESGLNVVGIHLTSIFPSTYEAEEKLYEVWDLLVHSNGITVPTGYVFNITPLAAPQYLGLDQNNYSIYTAAVTLLADRR